MHRYYAKMHQTSRISVHKVVKNRGNGALFAFHKKMDQKFFMKTETPG